MRLALSAGQPHAGRRPLGLLTRFENAERAPKYHRVLGEAYGRLTAYLDHYDIEQALEQLDWMRAEEQFFMNHPDFPADVSARSRRRRTWPA